MCESDTNDQIFLLCCVSDTGIGLSTDQQEIIFDSFSQADVSTTREFGGTGLGLTLCRKLCSLMKGTLWVESSKDEGSSFYFRIPIETGETNQLIDDNKISSTGHIEGRSMHPLDLLVVDDNNVNRDVAEMFLTNDGHRVKTATNGVEAIEILSMNRFDCVFMDIQMPKIDGVVATKLIRECEKKTVPPTKQYEQVLLKKLHAKIRNTHTPIIALTANVFQSDIKKYLAAGMDDHLGKPIKSKDIYQALRRATEHIEYEERDDQEITLLKEVTLSAIEKNLKDRYSFSSSQITTLIETSIISVQEGLDLLDQACLAGNKEELASAAHKLKGTLENLGLDQATELIKRIEISAKNDSNQPYSQWIAELRRDVEPIMPPDSTSK
jgi:CheY-like chemotaxis protein/HPt (histidine-containing phosphotransfer) domain-containing protein